MPGGSYQFDSKPLHVVIGCQDIEDLDVTSITGAGVAVVNPQRMFKCFLSQFGKHNDLFLNFRWSFIRFSFLQYRGIMLIREAVGDNSVFQVVIPEPMFAKLVQFV